MIEKAGKYKIEKELGVGGMGTVYRAIVPETGNTVAVKVLLPEFSSDHIYVNRFMREVKVMEELRHPNIISILDSGKESDMVYFVMEYVNGPSLARIMEEVRILSVEKATGIAIQTAKALQYAHRHNIVHRDVKPDNILLKEGKQVKLGDFGVAKPAGATRLTATGGIVGTPFYMSPEQAQGQIVDPSSDIYSLGVILYEMLTGKLPFKAANPVQLVRMLSTVTPDEPCSFNTKVSEELSAVIMGLIEKNPAKRFEDAGVVIKILDAMIAPA